MSNEIVSIVGKIPYFWIAFYEDGSILPQYEYNGTIHLFKEIDQSRLKKFGWFPFTKQLISILKSKLNDDRFIDNPSLPYFILELKDGQRIIALRREIQRIYTFSKCLKCGFEWQWMFGKSDGSIGDAGLPCYGEKYCYSLQHPSGKKFYEVICPKCGAKNDLVCPKCNEWWNKVFENNKFKFKCPKCNQYREERVLSNLEAHKIENIFLLGWQETTSDGRNRKMIMFIKPDGTFILSDDINAI